jgi:hypothetical protein
MEKRMLFQDNRSHFYLLTGRVFGFLITGVFLLFMVPEFIALLSNQSTNNEGWVFIFYLLSIAYGLGFLLSFWKVGLGGLLLVISSVLITLYSFIDSKSWVVLLLVIPLSFSGILFLLYWKKSQSE